ncbi:MAG: hypothetical protein WBQ38_00190 [Ignavibacteria bacterium]|nr:hypothetical protein [Ignavibacteria bacterium]MBK7445251.1 hypothetical protein [Ignavibacteria bacterium]MBK8383180.1 hypothetical protein [Ignavibacteria bacterium]MBK9403029.1 hypothetical protein [Ignavibacteria bacterium]MBL0107656.1 hypothetical protein [Ignavibacteria bacterium]
MNKKQHEKEDHENLVTVYATGNEAIVSVVKSVLDEAQIRYIAQGEGVQDLFGVGVIGTGFNPITGPIIFKVMPEDEEYAKELLKDISE